MLDLQNQKDTLQDNHRLQSRGDIMFVSNGDNIISGSIVPSLHPLSQTLIFGMRAEPEVA